MGNVVKVYYKQWWLVGFEPTTHGPRAKDAVFVNEIERIINRPFDHLQKVNPLRTKTKPYVYHSPPLKRRDSIIY